jgi:sugar phosphate isomerase/epimerase
MTELGELDKEVVCEAPSNGTPLMLCAGTIAKAKFRERVQAAAKAGFESISLFPEHYLNALRREKLNIDDMQEILAEHDVKLIEVDPLLGWFGDDASHSEGLIFEIADAFGARSVNVAPGAAPNLPLSAMTEVFGRLCERTKGHGFRLNLEFLPWTVIPDLSSALSIVQDCGQENAGITFDAWHFFRGGGQVEELRRLSPDDAACITNIQINDAPKNPLPTKPWERLTRSKEMLMMGQTSLQVMGAREFFPLASNARHPHANASAMMSETCFARLLPGEGGIPIKELLSAVEEAGAVATIGLEIFSQSLSKRPPAEVAQKAMQAYRSVMESSC